MPGAKGNILKLDPMIWPCLKLKFLDLPEFEVSKIRCMLINLS